MMELFHCSLPGCQFVTQRRYSLTRHEETHKPHRRLYSCHLCPARYFRQESVKKHILVSHGINSDRQQGCRSRASIPLLKKKTAGRSNRKTDKRSQDRVIRNAGSLSNKVFTCTVAKTCQFQTIHEYSLTRHVKTHKKSKFSLTCPICAAVCGRKDSLKRHMGRKHASENAFPPDASRDRMHERKRTEKKEEAFYTIKVLTCPKSSKCRFRPTYRKGLKCHLDSQEKSKSFHSSGGATSTCFKKDRGYLTRKTWTSAPAFNSDDHISPELPADAISHEVCLTDSSVSQNRRLSSRTARSNSLRSSAILQPAQNHINTSCEYCNYTRRLSRFIRVHLKSDHGCPKNLLPPLGALNCHN